LALLGDRAGEKAEPVEGVHFTRDDFGNWRASYNYDAHGPKWRLEDRETSTQNR